MTTQSMPHQIPRRWAASMWSSLLATLSRPDWWAMALAGFLLRGGIVLVVLPLISLPSVAAIATVVAPTIEKLVIGGETLQGALLAAIALATALIALVSLGLAGAWFDLALLDEATDDEDLAFGWRSGRMSVSQALSIRLLAHLPTIAALAYAIVRIVGATYDELLSPGNTADSLVARVFDRTPDAVVIVVIAWLLGETVGSLAVRHASAGATTRTSLWASTRHVLGARGLATLGLTSAVVLAVVVPFALAIGRAWEHVRSYLLERVDTAPLAAALVLLVGTWILGLSILGAALAWRASAWTTEVTPD